MIANNLLKKSIMLLLIFLNSKKMKILTLNDIENQKFNNKL